MFFSDFARAAFWWQLDFSFGSCTDESACLAFASCSSPNLAVADAQRALLLRHILRSHVCDFERQGHALSGCRPAQLPALLSCIGLILMFSAHDSSVPASWPCASCHFVILLPDRFPLFLVPTILSVLINGLMRSEVSAYVCPKAQVSALHFVTY